MFLTFLEVSEPFISLGNFNPQLPFKFRGQLLTQVPYKGAQVFEAVVLVLDLLKSVFLEES